MDKIVQRIFFHTVGLVVEWEWKSVKVWTGKENSELNPNRLSGYHITNYIAVKPYLLSFISFEAAEKVPTLSQRDIEINWFYQRFNRQKL